MTIVITISMNSDGGCDNHLDWCEWSTWSVWTACADPCSGGVRQRFRWSLASLPGSQCKSQQTQSQSCNTGLCPGTTIDGQKITSNEDMAWFKWDRSDKSTGYSGRNYIYLICFTKEKEVNWLFRLHAAFWTSWSFFLFLGSFVVILNYLL